jgi:hypothetical protein
MRAKPGHLFLVAALSAAAPAGADDPAAAIPPPDGLLRALAGLERRAERVRDDVEAAHARAQAPPEPFTRDVSRVRFAARALTHGLHGQPSATVMPLLERLDRLERRLARVEARIAEEPVRILRTPRIRTALATGVITGRVTNARTGAPVTFDRVEVFDAAGDYVDYGFTDETGVYQVDQLSTGTYFVLSDSFDFVNELFDNIVCDAGCEVTTGTPVGVVDGQATMGINFALVPLSVVEGTILDATTLAPIAGVRLRLLNAQGGWEGFGTSGPDGHYVMDGVHPGVHFMVAEHDTYLDEVFDHVPCQPECDPTTGTPIPVTVGTNVTGIDFRLRLGGSLSGRIVDAGDGEPLSTLVEVYDATGDFVGYVYADGSGFYQKFDLATGTYFVRTESYTHADELYDNLPCAPSCTPTQGTPIAVTAGQERPSVDFALLRMGSMAGRVTNAAGGGLAAEVRVFDAQGAFRASGYSDRSGAYLAGGLLAGSYFATVAAPGYLGELYDNLPCHPSCTPTVGTAIPVVLGATTAGVDFRLDLGGWVTGAVRRQSNGAVVIGADVRVYRSDGQMVDSETTGQTGAFMVDGLGAGSYYAEADAAGFLSELYREIACDPGCPPPVSGTAIPVVVGQESGGVDFTLTRLGRITGRVTETGNGLPVSTLVYLYGGAGQIVGIASAYSGSYLFTGIPPGTYFVRTDTPFNENIVDELYDNRTCEPSCTVTTGTAVTAALDATTSGIDFSLRRPVFVDVPVTHFAWRFVEALYNAGVTGGCGGPPQRYCPDSSVTRAQMALFVLRSKEGPTYLPPPAVGMFTDVPVGDPFARWIEELARRQIASGCSVSPPRFCPNDPTTRAQMAPLLLVTREGGGYVPPPATGLFQDVPVSDPFARWIEELVGRQVTGGCSANPPLYCPGQAASRAQMAVFLSTMFALALP